MPSDTTGPSLEFEWELALFKGLRAVASKLFRTNESQKRTPFAITIDQYQKQLTIVAQLTSSLSLQVKPTAGRAWVSGPIVFVPYVIDGKGSYEANKNAYLVRTLLGAEIARKGLQKKVPNANLEQIDYTHQVILEAASTLEEQYPNVRMLIASAAQNELSLRQSVDLTSEEYEIEQRRINTLARLAGVTAPVINNKRGRGKSQQVTLWGTLLDWSSLSAEEQSVAKEYLTLPTQVTTEKKIKNADIIKHIRLDEKKIQDATLMHTFEKIETADTYEGGGRDLDGADQAEEHEEALNEVMLSVVTRSDEQVHAVLKADVGANSQIPEVEDDTRQGRAIYYDEWDYQSRTYRKDYCRVFVEQARANRTNNASVRLKKNERIISEVEREIRRSRDRLSPKNRQPDGERVDIDALVRHLAEVRSGHSLETRLYVRRARPLPSMATLLLVDSSLSSDSWIDNQRVLDLEQDAALVLGEVNERLGETLQIMSFYSNTRNQCQMIEVRMPNDSWRTGQQRLFSLKPQGYTRIGPAIRHATATLEKTDCKHRVILLLTDGKPTDYDRYEGRYGIEDVRQAVREAEQRRIVVHGLTLDPNAASSFPAMFGAARFHVVHDIRKLPMALGQVFGRLQRLRDVALYGLQTAYTENRRTRKVAKTTRPRRFE